MKNTPNLTLYAGITDVIADTEFELQEVTRKLVKEKKLQISIVRKQNGRSWKRGKR